MLEWLEVRLDVGCDKRLMYEYRFEPLKYDRDALKQECRLARIACSDTQPPTHLSEKIQRASSYCPQSFERDWYKKKALGETRILGLLPKDGKFYGASSRMTWGIEVRLSKRTDHCDVPCHGLAPCQETRVRPIRTLAIQSSQAGRLLRGRNAG